MTDAFRDHFSDHASSYAAYRPTYPRALFERIAREAPPDGLVWDCATGNGQAAVALATHFPRVIGTDASANQIQHAQPHENVTYDVCRADDSGLDAGSVGVVTVGQALHWFDRDPFVAEVERVTRPDALVVAWCYGLFEVTPGVDAVVQRLYHDVVGPDWPPERRHVESGYTRWGWPWPLLDWPGFAMEADWSADAVLGYLRTWSACKRYEKRTGKDPVGSVEAELRAEWGAEQVRRARWPLSVLASRLV